MNFLELYNDYLIFERNLSKRTVITYGTQVSHFLDFIKKQDISVENVQAGDIRNYLEYCKDNGDSDTTLGLIITVLKSFYRYLNKDKLVNSNPTIKIEQIKLKKAIPSTLSVEEVESILRAIDDTDIYGYRDKTLIEFLFSTGARISECVDLKLNNININEKQVNLLGKGNKMRITFLSDVSIEMLKHYLLDIRPKILEDRNSNYVFVGKKNEQLNRSYVLTLVKKYAKMAGITKEISPHTFRHSFATSLLENNADLVTVKTLLGHSNIATTQIYTHVTKNLLKDSYKKAHPFARKDEEKDETI